MSERLNLVDLIYLKCFLQRYFFSIVLEYLTWPLQQLPSMMMNLQDFSGVEVMSLLVYFLKLTVSKVAGRDWLEISSTGKWKIYDPINHTSLLVSFGLMVVFQPDACPNYA